ncbi:5'/3'-nucleotidase SurE [Baekduia sp. Peel2402]|uniref:5'/3'-nucleotidase SurE n=1 Tax=Baekduia sp. Peel2402 TaxID=3458296 RepID=UPI00403EAC52
MNARRSLLPPTLLAAAALALAPAADAKTTKVKELRVLVSNDDGVKAPGIDALVKGLRKLPKVKVTVVAPAVNQSGTGGKTTTGTLKATKTTTKSGYPAIAVAGFPADSINYALSKVVKKSQVDLVVSGINAGVNLGPFIDLSGTVGAARAAAQKGLPALATSAGTLTVSNFTDGVTQTIAWVKANRTKLKPGTVQNLNIPECSAGHARAATPTTSSAKAPDGVNVFAKVDCTQTAKASTDEITAFEQGFATLSKIPSKPAS